MARYLISGVSRGIGRALAQRLAADGHEVLGTARSADSAAALAGRDDLGGGLDCLALAGVLVADLADPDSLAGSLRPALDSVDSLDGVVHCAGIVRPGPLAETTPADFAEQFAVNVTAVAELTRLLLPALRAVGGTVVFVNSGSGLNARTPLATYAASKFALRAYADALRSEEPGLRVSTVYPGRTSTDMQREVRAAEAGEYDEKDYLRPETVAGVLASVLALPADGLITDLTLRPSGRG